MSEGRGSALRKYLGHDLPAVRALLQGVGVGGPGLGCAVKQRLDGGTVDGGIPVEGEGQNTSTHIKVRYL